MCGIAGILGIGDRERLQRMTDAMRHRGPDDEGMHVANRISLGMRRLSIIDVEKGHQPIYSQNRSKVIVFNGEIYNYRELRSELEKKGVSFRTNSDTETILHAYEMYGHDCVHHFNGMFAFAIWDAEREELFIARDRLGIKPLFYARRGSAFIFASEIKALLASGLIDKTVDPEAILTFLSWYNLPVPYTMFKGVFQLPPGHFLRIVPGGELRVEKYWDIPFVPENEKPVRTIGELSSILRELITDAVQKRLVAEVPLGAFLSGGIDSSLVVGLMSRMSDQPVKTFTVGFRSSEKKYDERDFARVIAEKYRTDHSEVVVSGSDVRNSLPEIIRYMDLPSGDAIQTYFISEAARRRVTVSLSGLGGDELFAGYQQFQHIPGALKFARRYQQLPAWLATVLRSIRTHLPAEADNKMKLRLLFEVIDGRTDLLHLYNVSRSVYPEDEFGALLNKPFINSLPWQGLTRQVLEKYRESIRGLELADAISYLEFKTYMSHMLLRDTDAMSMAHSLEVRVPLIDHTVVEFVARNVPVSLKRRNGRSKWLLTETFKDILPAEVVSRKKRGFEFPMPVWLRDELRDVVEDCLSPQSVRNRGVFDEKGIHSLKSRFFSATRRVPYLKIWTPVVLELWFREFIDGS
ncbi:MAG: asparagine synthase (glutamine-hydrolyzing) [Chlorobi bacterium]|nr:asparagine synthase (glutamine-hydrolyzing) [Chlorobiota bacterium]